MIGRSKQSKQQQKPTRSQLDLTRSQRDQLSEEINRRLIAPGAIFDDAFIQGMVVYSKTHFPDRRCSALQVRRIHDPTVALPPSRISKKRRFELELLREEEEESRSRIERVNVSPPYDEPFSQSLDHRHGDSSTINISYDQTSTVLSSPSRREARSRFGPLTGPRAPAYHPEMLAGGSRGAYNSMRKWMDGLERHVYQVVGVSNEMIHRLRQESQEGSESTNDMPFSINSHSSNIASLLAAFPDERENQTAALQAQIQQNEVHIASMFDELSGMLKAQHDLFHQLNSLQNSFPSSSSSSSSPLQQAGMSSTTRYSAAMLQSAAALCLVSIPAGKRCRMDGVAFAENAMYGDQLTRLFEAAHGMSKRHMRRPPSLPTTASSTSAYQAPADSRATPSDMHMSMMSAEDDMDDEQDDDSEHGFQ